MNNKNISIEFFKINKDVFLEAFICCKKFLPDEDRLGYSFTVKNNILEVATTDFYRINIYRSEIKFQDVSIIIRSEINMFLNDIKKYASNDDFRIGFDNKNLYISYSNREIKVKLSENGFPNYQHIIYNQCNYSVSFNKKDIDINKIIELSKNEKPKHMIVFKILNKDITISYLDKKDALEATEINYNERMFKICLNAKLLKDIFELCGENIKIQFSSHNEAIRVDSEKNISLMMPILCK